LTVVSSDHRVQRAARRRKARPVDSERWYADRLAERGQKHQRRSPASLRGEKPLDAAEVDYWLAEFSDTPANASSGSTPPPAASDDMSNPFPPGYGEDLLEDEAP
jgi:hypothetical protein